MSYARARLFLGISGVGSVVVATGLVAAFWGRSGNDVGTPTSFSGEVATLAAFFGCWAVALLPFDLLGGYVLPRACGRRHPPFGRFLVGLIRGVAVQGVVLFAVAVATLAACRAFGDGAALGVVFVAVVVLGMLQSSMAIAVGGLPPAYRTDAGFFIQAVKDEGFTGGVFGLFRPQVLLPARWSEALSAEEFEAVVARRRAVIASGERLAGLLGAAAWVLAGTALALLLPQAGGQTATQVVVLYCGTTWWTFLGLLLLPTLSRNAVLGLDERVRRDGVSDDVLRSASSKLDALQDDEPSRPTVVESIFHPLPSVENRGEAARPPGVGTWHIARTMVYLSWATGGLLSRSVHCNAGRPQLWVFLPCD
ncbi:MAG: hypothetical protein AAF532_05665 [Planctomycetota bacterium]